MHPIGQKGAVATDGRGRHSLCPLSHRTSSRLRKRTDDYPVCDEMILKAAEVIVKVVGAKTTNSVNHGDVRSGLRRDLSPHGDPSRRTLTQNLKGGYLKGARCAFVHSRGPVASTIGTCTNRPS